MNTISTSRTLHARHGAFGLWRRLRWLTHPITVFVALQIVWLAITVIWVIWFVGQQEAIAELAQKFGREYFDTRVSLAILVTGCVLLGVLLVGTILLFVFYQRQSSLALQQRTFVSSVTHELKSPLASLQLALETMDARELDPQTADRLKAMIHTDIDRLRRLVDQILMAGRLDRGILTEEDAQVINVRELIDRMRESLSYLDSELAKRLEIDCPPDLEIRTSRGALMLILSNLVENAIKYSKRTDTIFITATVETDSRLLLSVEDHGLGLDQKDKRRIFKMFHRSTSAIKNAIPGTGLGLYIVRTAVRSLGGSVWAESLGRDQGATFYVSLPLNDARRAHG